jgi:hypothetical protein
VGAPTHRDKVASARIGNLLGELSSFSRVVDQVEVIAKPGSGAKRSIRSQREHWTVCRSRRLLQGSTTWPLSGTEGNEDSPSDGRTTDRDRSLEREMDGVIRAHLVSDLHAGGEGPVRFQTALTS